MKERKSLEQLFLERAEEDGFVTVVPIGKAIEAAKEFLIKTPNRAMIFEQDGNSISLLSKRELLDTLTSKVKQVKENTTP
jgi:hypothetical protein